MKASAFGLTFAFAFASAAYCIPVVSTNQTATQLATTLAGTGITITNAVFSGTGAQNAVYSGSTVEAQGNANLTNGIILSSGNAGSMANTSNTSDGFAATSGITNGPSDADLQTLVPGATLFDAAFLEFDFVAAGAGTTTVSFWYTFGSDEYNEFVGTRFNDVFGFFLNGVNVALLPGTTTPVSINTVNADVNPTFYVDNDPTTVFPNRATELDGFSVPLSVEFAVQAGESNRLKLAIADAGDRILDSWVMLGGGSLRNVPPNTPPGNGNGGGNGTPPPIPEPGTMALMALGLAGLACKARGRKRAAC